MIQIRPWGEGECRVAAWWIADRNSHVNLISHTLMAWTDVWPGNQEREREKKSTCFQAFRQTAYVPPRWLFHLGLVNANRSEQQSRKTDKIVSGEMLLWVLWVAFYSRMCQCLQLSPGQILSKGLKKTERKKKNLERSGPNDEDDIKYQCR